MKIGSNDANTQTMRNTVKKKSYDPIPKGAYRAQLIECVERLTKKGDGTYLDCKFRVMDGEHKNRLVFHKFNIDSPYAKCKEIGLDQLNRFLKVSGQSQGLAGLDFDTDRVQEFLNRDIVINVKVEKGTNGYKDRNAVTSFAVV